MKVGLGIRDFKDVKQRDNDDMCDQHEGIDLVPGLENGRLVLIEGFWFGIRHWCKVLILSDKNSPCPAHGVVFNSS